MPTRARQFALRDMEYEQPLARLDEAIAAIDVQLDNGSSSTSSSTEHLDRLQVERQGLAAQRNALAYGAKAMSEDIARRSASDGNVQLAIRLLRRAQAFKQQGPEQKHFAGWLLADCA